MSYCNNENKEAKTDVNTLVRFIHFLWQQEKLAKKTSPAFESHQEKREAVYRAVNSVFQSDAAEKSGQIRAEVSSMDKHWAEAESLRQMAVRALRSTLGTTNRQKHQVDPVISPDIR